MNKYCLIDNKNNIADSNGYGCVNYNFMISKNFISYQEYLDFVNSEPAYASNPYILSNIMQQKCFTKHNNTFVCMDSDKLNEPLTYITLNNLKCYCNWMNGSGIQAIDKYPYNVQQKSNTLNNQIEYWIPNYNEWYKACYYNPANGRYWKYPNATNSLEHYSKNNNTITPYLLFNGGLKYYTIIHDEHNTQNKTMISGGSFNRHTNNALAGVKKFISHDFVSNYISARLCKRNPRRHMQIILINDNGLGWGDSSLTILDDENNIIIENMSIKNGCGPVVYDIYVDLLLSHIKIKYKPDLYNHNANSYIVYDADRGYDLLNTQNYKTIKQEIILELC